MREAILATYYIDGYPERYCQILGNELDLDIKNKINEEDCEIRLVKFDVDGYQQELEYNGLYNYDLEDYILEGNYKSARSITRGEALEILSTNV